MLLAPLWRTRHAIAALLALVAACAPGAWGREDSGGATGTAQVCQERCSANADCQPGWECRDNRCATTTSGGNRCSNDDDCQIAASGWASNECDAGADCPGQVCVAFAGRHFCAVQPSASVDCSRLHMAEVQLTQLGGGPVPVCANLEWKCEASTCVFRCTGDPSCSGLLPVCDTAAGICQCRTSPDSCGPNTSGGAVCVRGACGCSDDRDCVGVGFDRCSGGRCGCAGVLSCDDYPRVHPGTTVVCE